MEILHAREKIRRRVSRVKGVVAARMFVKCGVYIRRLMVRGGYFHEGRVIVSIHGEGSDGRYNWSLNVVFWWHFWGEGDLRVKKMEQKIV